ncbi:glycosyltransferase [Halorussus salilacus]|uniref:glycosyltransferase n=1 Tax=Halorussus salilacus TaxID=2953750 RepID=UPI0020A19C08|nr:glycosyltransferase [Halorussus salilacus]USZ68102.1 glycosyltransferase [Halorussus salilacus]
MRVLSLVPNDATFHRQETAALADAGVERTVMTVPGDPRERSVADYLRFVPRVIRESSEGYDLLHANYGLTAPAALAQRRLPVVLSLWGSDLLGEYGWLSKACARRCEEVVVMSEGMAAELDCPAHVLPHGVDGDRFRPVPKSEARQSVGWSADARHVLFPYAPDRPIKDFPRAGRVVEAARERVDAPVELHVLGGVDHAEVPAYMNAADALLLTSEREGSPNVVREAMSCGLPVVATDVGDVRERLDGVSPSAVADTDGGLAGALADLLVDPRRSDGREAVADLRVERTAERLRAVYELALDRGGIGVEPTPT